MTLPLKEVGLRLSGLQWWLKKCNYHVIMRIEDELKCIGYHGFGAGYVYAKANATENQSHSGQDSYCAKQCKLATECFQRHYQRINFIAPQAAVAFDKLRGIYGEEHARKLWQKRNPNVFYDPYTFYMMANLESGFHYALHGETKPQGRFTVKLPHG
jgi:hypothetical protein